MHGLTKEKHEFPQLIKHSFAISAFSCPHLSQFLRDYRSIRENHTPPAAFEAPIVATIAAVAVVAGLAVVATAAWAVGAAALLQVALTTSRIMRRQRLGGRLLLLLLLVLLQLGRVESWEVLEDSTKLLDVSEKQFSH